MTPQDTLECGETVEHQEYGQGRVIGTDNGPDKRLRIAYVRFVEYGGKCFDWEQSCHLFTRVAKEDIIDYRLVIKETKALEDVIRERVRQDEKWGIQNHDIFLYLTILGEEFGETCQAALEARFGKDKATEPLRYLKLREEAVQTAAVALAIVECLDRGAWNWGSHAEKP